MHRNLIAIDPGPVASAAVLYDRETRMPINWVKLPNEKLKSALITHGDGDLAIEMIASYGMAVGKEVFETCVWIGRFIEAWEGHKLLRRAGQVVRVTRMDVKSHLCRSAKAGDPNVRAALIDRFGPGKEKAIGLKATPGPLYGLTGDCWAALGVAVTVADCQDEVATAAALIQARLVQHVIGGEM